MVPLIPVFLLLFAIAALAGASRLQPGFRSHWMVAIGGALLAAISLLVILFRLPVAGVFSGWAISAQIQFPITLSINSLSWPLGFAIVLVLLIGLLSQMRQPVSLDWRAWAPGLLLAAVGLVATFSADLLALAVSFFVLDSLAYAVHLRSSQDAESRNSALLRYAINLSAVVVILAAWSLLQALPWLSQDLILPAVALRLGLFTPRLFQLPTFPRRELDLMLRFTGPITALSALILWNPVGAHEPLVAWLLLFFLGLLIFAFYGPTDLLPRFVERLRLPGRPNPISLIPPIANGIHWCLELLARTLEGEAGLLWAFLFIGLFLSLASQFGH